MAYSEVLIQQVWERGRAMPDQDWNHWRKDECGAWMLRDQYGSTTSEFGWKIEDVSVGQDGGAEHLRPFHHGNHFDRASHQAHCTVTADRDHAQPTAHIGEPKNREI